MSVKHNLLVFIFMIMNFRALFMLMTFLRFQVLKSLFFIDLFCFIKLYNIFFELNIKKRFFILTNINQLFFKWNFAWNFSRDHHIKYVTQTVKIKHKLIFLYKQMLCHSAHLLDCFLIFVKLLLLVWLLRILMRILIILR